MRNIKVKIIAFKRLPEEGRHIYALNETGTPAIGGYFFNPETTPFLHVEHIMHESQLIKKLPIIEATDNDIYELPKLPASLVKAFTDSGEESLHTYLRLP